MVRLVIMKVVMVLFSLFSFNSFAQECQLAVDSISAQYQVTENDDLIKTSLKQGDTVIKVELHRKGNSVLQRFANTGISNIWSKMSNKRISLVRVFEQYQHAIEYQPNEISQKPSWQSINQLLPTPEIEKMTLVSKAGDGCKLEEHYQLNAGEDEYQLTWLPELALVRHFKIKTRKLTKQWKLMSIEVNSARSADLFAQYMNYSSTDYADIGDNESNPFLAKMIHQGFIPRQHSSHDEHQH